MCDRPNQRIVVNADAPPNAQLRILVHETAHALGIDYQTYTRQQAEVMVDTITYIVCAGLGLTIDGESIPYVAGWAKTAHGTPSTSSPPRSTGSPARSRTPSPAPPQPLRAKRRTTGSGSAQNPR